MTVTKHTPLPEMVQWLMPDTAAYLDDQTPEIQMACLRALRSWMYKREATLEDLDAVDLATMVHTFVTSFVRRWKEWE